jgi:hypothetical protein
MLVQHLMLDPGKKEYPENTDKLLRTNKKEKK